MTEGQCQFRPKPKKTERQLSAFGRNRNYAERGHLPTFGAETETEAEFRSASISDLGIRLPRTPPFSHLLRHAGGYSRTILTPNLHILVHIYSGNLSCSGNNWENSPGEIYGTNVPGNVSTV